LPFTVVSRACPPERSSSNVPARRRVPPIGRGGVL
jgi:hypothetical protein